MDTFFGLYFPSAESYHWKLKPKVLYQILFEFMTGESRGGSMEPPFEGLPSKILYMCKCTMYTMPTLELRRSRPYAFTVKQRFYSCIAPSAAKDGDMLSVWECLFSAPYADKPTVLQPLQLEVE